MSEFKEESRVPSEAVGDKTRSARFNELKPGQTGKIVRYVCEDACAVRLQEMGLCPGTEFRVVKVAPLGDPVEVEFRQCRLCLRRSETDQIDVEVPSSE